MDRFQQLMTCCGVNNYTDYFTTEFANSTQTVPGSCCDSSANCPPRAAITPEQMASGGLHENGCFDVLVDFLSGKLKMVASLALICAFAQLLGALNSCLLAKYINKAVYETLN